MYNGRRVASDAALLDVAVGMPAVDGISCGAASLPWFLIGHADSQDARALAEGGSACVAQDEGAKSVAGSAQPSADERVRLAIPRLRMSWRGAALGLGAAVGTTVRRGPGAMRMRLGGCSGALFSCATRCAILHWRQWGRNTNDKDEHWACDIASHAQCGTGTVGPALLVRSLLPT